MSSSLPRTVQERSPKGCTFSSRSSSFSLPSAKRPERSLSVSTESSNRAESCTSTQRRFATEANPLTRSVLSFFGHESQRFDSDTELVRHRQNGGDFSACHP